MIKLIYTFFLGLLVALFIGVGISAFYPEPKEPSYPKVLEREGVVSPEATETLEVRAARLEYEREWRNHQKKIQLYSRNVSLITLAFSLIILVISLLFLHKLLIISDGLLLGGVFTLAYSITRGFASQDEKYRFMIVSIGLLVALLLGYMKFIRPSSTSETQ